MLKLSGLKNTQCAETIAQAINAVDGVSDVRVSFEASRATVTYDEGRVSLVGLKRVVEDAGYQIAKPVHGEDGACCGGCGG
ncbi:heavy-metal-associated domain-containing protein [Paracandidimonas lactea]|uniref:heavy-metal-associated domain-containing protein n=1 Tax=Paracandidimonas lactea TaxID=2895524 RepID=UPI001EF0E9ED|nr:heavy-metal-associated domain-containing protein [Paracandidimonas lactea]